MARHAASTMLLASVVISFISVGVAGSSSEGCDRGTTCNQPKSFDDETSLLQVPSESAIKKRIGSADDFVAIAQTRQQAHRHAESADLRDRREKKNKGSSDSPNIGLVEAATRLVSVIPATTTILILACVGFFAIIAFVVVGWYMALAVDEEKANIHRQAINSVPREVVASPRSPRDAGAKSSASESCPESDKEAGDSCDQVTFAFGCYFPAQVIFSTITAVLLTLQQILVLPLRPCGGYILTRALSFGGSFTASLYCIFCCLNHGERAYGRIIEDFETYEDLLEKHSASKRKNIRRNYRAAEKELAHHGIQVTFCPAGTFRFTREMRDLLWHQCLRHNERAHSYADIANCKQPVSPWLMYLGEVLVVLGFPCDIQLFRAADGKLIAFNTRVHFGNVYMNPNYACLEEYKQLGIYAWSHWHAMDEAFRVRASIVNFMATMRGPKRALGMRPLSMWTLICAFWSFTRSPQEEAFEVKTKKSQTPRSPCAGGKRSARKKAAAAASPRHDKSEDSAPWKGGTKGKQAGQSSPKPSGAGKEGHPETVPGVKLQEIDRRLEKLEQRVSPRPETST